MILALNKRVVKSKSDIFAEEYFTEVRVCLCRGGRGWGTGVKRGESVGGEIVGDPPNFYPAGLRGRLDAVFPQVPLSPHAPAPFPLGHLPPPLQADADAMALFALEVGDALAARSLECAYASALSVVSQGASFGGSGAGCRGGCGGEGGSGGGGAGGTGGGAGGGGNGNRTSLADESAARLRSQLMSMYFKVWGAGEGGGGPHTWRRGAGLCFAEHGREGGREGGGATWHDTPERSS